jgi:peroxiredoxin (alkyl hydroperoxide reductase subunit C)
MSEENHQARGIELGGIAPDFEANTTHGPIKFGEWQGDSWVILFSHPADFTPVCTTEMVEFAKRFEEFEKRNVKLIGNSVDSVFSHIAWMRNIQEKFEVEVKFPIIADLDQKVSRLYGMLHEPTSATAAVRCVFFLDPHRVVRAMIYYPLNLGRNFDEILRVVDGLQTADSNGVACPANWTNGEDVIVPPPTTMDLAAERVADSSVTAKDWYFAKKSL